MKYMARNANEEAMLNIAKQMRIYNSMKLLEEIYLKDGMEREEYLERLKDLLAYA